MVTDALPSESKTFTKTNSPLDTAPVKRPLKRGSAKGKVEIRNDFDEPLEDFQEYME